MSFLSTGGLRNLKSWVSSRFTYDFLEQQARKTGFLKRKRKLDPVYLVIVLIFGVSNHLHPTMEEIHRRYVDFDDSLPDQTPIKNQSFRKRFNKNLVEYLKVLLDYYIDQMNAQSPIKLKGIVQSFKDILIQDSSIIRLSKKLYELHPAARSRNNSAGLKIHAVYSTSSHSIRSTTVTTERVHDAKMVDIGEEAQNSLYLFDLGYYSLKRFSKIHESGGFFISRVKSNAVPEVKEIRKGCSDFLSIVDINRLTGIKLGDFLNVVPDHGVYDLTCSFIIGHHIENKTRMPIIKDFRVICIWNFIAKKWQVYVTNLPDDSFSPGDIYDLYRYRWVIELIFKELKSDYDLGKMLLADAYLAYIHIYSMLLRLIISRELYCWIVSSTQEEKKNKYTPMLWSKVFAEKALEFLSILNQDLFGEDRVDSRWAKLEWSLRHLSKNRNNNQVLALNYSQIL